MCLYPVTCYFYPAEDGHTTNTFSFKVASKHAYIEKKVPCGKCPECLYQRKRLKGLQAHFESKNWRRNCYITLTYNDENLPADYSVHWSAVQLFMARLRKHCKGDMAVVYNGKVTRPIRFFGCGEYGDQPMDLPGLTSRLGRPHFHIILFNFDFSDKYFWRWEDNRPVYRSPFLESIWTFGNSEIEEVGVGACMYVAGYVEKKKHQKSAEQYCIVVKDTGEVKYVREPELSRASNRPGLGYFFLKKYADDIVRDDYVMAEPGKKNNLPKYFDKLLERDPGRVMRLIENKRIRKSKAEEKPEEDWLRIQQKEEYLLALNQSKKTMKGIKL